MRLAFDKEIFAGMAVTLIGAATSIHAATSLSLGTVSRMGPGMVPAALGVILTLLGLAIVLPAIKAMGRESIKFDTRPFLTILLSVLMFAATIRPFGMIPAIMILTLVASRADSKLGLPKVLLLGSGLSGLIFLIFGIAIGVRTPAFNFPGIF